MRQCMTGGKLADATPLARVTKDARSRESIPASRNRSAIKFLAPLFEGTFDRFQSSARLFTCKELDVCRFTIIVTPFGAREVVERLPEPVEDEAASPAASTADGHCRWPRKVSRNEREGPVMVNAVSHIANALHLARTSRRVSVA
jgi:hypothetical protein